MKLVWISESDEYKKNFLSILKVYWPSDGKNVGEKSKRRVMCDFKSFDLNTWNTGLEKEMGKILNVGSCDYFREGSDLALLHLSLLNIQERVI